MNLKSFVFLFTCCFGVSLSQVYYYPWMYYLPYGEEVTLKPLYRNKSEVGEIVHCKWTTPKNVDLNPDLLNYDTNRFYIEKSSCELTIFDNQKDTNGVYHCTVNHFFISKAMLNVHGAPKESLLEEYTPNLIAGFSTAGGIIAFFAFTCGVYKFRYKDTSVDKSIKRASSERVESTNGQVNLAYNQEQTGTIRL